MLLARAGDNRSTSNLEILLCGGIAGCISWLSIYPLDVIKTRVQAQSQAVTAPLLEESSMICAQKGTWACTKITYGEGGIKVFFRGLGVW